MLQTLITTVLLEKGEKVLIIIIIVGSWGKVSVSTYVVCCVAGEMLSVAEVFLEQEMHPTIIIAAYRKALDDIVTLLKDKIRYMT